MSNIEIMIILTLIGFCSYYSYRKGQSQGVKETLEYLEGQGIIAIERE